MELKFVNLDNTDLRALIDELDDWFVQRYGAEYENYRGRNSLVGISCAVVAYEGKEPIGCGCWRALDEVTAELKRVYVRAAARKSGVATHIVTALEAHAAAIGAHRMVLETAADMPDAIACYRALGYAQITRYGSYVDDETVCCMGKTISDGTMR